VLGYGWIKRGEDAEVPSNTGRRRLNINGAVDLERLEPVVRYDDTIDATSTIALFDQILLAYTYATCIYIICDNAGYCQDKLENGDLCLSVSSGIDVMRNDWCLSGQCDTTCVECWSPNLINVARGLIDANYRSFDCPAGQVCCNASCGICTPPGFACIQIACQ